MRHETPEAKSDRNVYVATCADAVLRAAGTRLGNYEASSRARICAAMDTILFDAGAGMRNALATIASRANGYEHGDDRVQRTFNGIAELALSALSAKD